MNQSFSYVLNNADTVLHRTTKFGRITQVAGAYFQGSATPLQQEGGIQRSLILWVPLCLCTHTLTPNYQIWRDMGRRYVLRGHPRPYPKGAESQRSTILGFISIRVHPLTQNYQISQSNTHSDWVYVYLVSHTLIPRGGVPELPNFTFGPLIKIAYRAYNLCFPLTLPHYVYESLMFFVMVCSWRRLLRTLMSETFERAHTVCIQSKWLLQTNDC